MKKIPVRLGDRSYSIIVGRNLLSSLGRFLKPLQLGSKVLIVSNKKVAGYFLKTVSRSLAQSGFKVSHYLLSHGNERDKSEQELLKLWQAMARIPLDRKSAVLALGGGVVGDLAGFAASTYMRGIPFIQIPSTLLAQVDSAIGGKTGIDLRAAKNMVGTFYHPRLVLADIDTLRRLPLAEFQNSFSEVIKYGMIQDAGLFRLLENKLDWFLSSAAVHSFGAKQMAFLETVVWRSARIKAKVVEEDEREMKGKRMILNYGHTFAHALEGASGFKVSHGQAVAWGMILAGELAVRLGIFSPQAQIRQKSLIQKLGFRLQYTLSARKIMSFMKRDKKVVDGKLRLILPRGIGRVEVNDKISKKQVQKVLNQFGSKP